ncbi:MAG: hypothetical protein QOJ70_1101 [Acidobacteriota bacterium]|jgi:hypothetical protein|nr:hypothetical protein [Acidobacteriota bacterium]
MPYSEKARELRRCTQPKADGSRCRAWAVWGDSRQLCAPHGRHHRGKMRGRRSDERTHFEPCTCLAYAWPHRPGGGLCRWPDPPLFRRTTPANTHEWPRMSPAEKAFMRMIQWRHHGRRFP